MQVNPAINPSISATVSASAGTGKTWSLVSRIIRLLINGAEPGSILAITFTRKAAAEMQSRLNERLLELASCSDELLQQNLQLIGSPITADSITQARNLYEKILYSNHPPRITTFHAMCQELLKRFPFDANVPPGFELTEQTTDLENEARDLLFNQATLDNNGEIAQALETLFVYCGGLENTRTALDNFLMHRSDWWAFTLNQKNPVDFATDNLKKLLNIESNDDPVESFFDKNLLAKLSEFVELLAKHPIKKNQESIDSINLLLTQIESKNYSPAFENLYKTFFTTTGSPRSRKASATQKSKMGEAGELRFLELHDFFTTEIEKATDKQAKLNTFELCSAWYKAGQQFLNHFQTIKSEQRVLDFADLEWNAFLLLSDENHATWIQYKLDSRINHVLIDEYQDTNPTQWQLLKPLLEEICSSNDERNRSIFIVGDTKQSIYRFRRAQPKLFDIAQQWMDKNIESVNSSLEQSRRSSPAIINFVNTVFEEGPLRENIVNFENHTTHLQNLWGKVVIPPLFVSEDDTAEPEEHDVSQTEIGYRNPLLAPLLTEEDQRRVNEARFIANEISTLIANDTIVGTESSERYLNYSDIIILLGQRTHASIYQQELNALGIPYVGISKGTLLETLEIRDLSALLNLLITPFDNLALAQVLKSPIFNCNDQELISLATLKFKSPKKVDWFERLLLLSEQAPDQQPIQRAVRLLSAWKKDIGRLPVHDLLDKIVNESNLINRYVAAYPGHLKHSVESNLNRFIELALEIDSGRYPSVSRFLQRLNSLRDNQKDAPDELPAGKNTDRVRLMTIHAAKGLEAPVIFLADSNSSPQNKEAYQAVVNWPAESDRPECFLLAPRKDDQDSTVKNIFATQNSDIKREQANLLYVALTRAKQLLYITGSHSKRDSKGAKWYDMIKTQLEKHSDKFAINPDGTIELSSHRMPDIALKAPGEKQEKISIATAELSRPFDVITTETNITPSLLSQTTENIRTDNQKNSDNTDAQQRGIIIHKILQLLTESPDRQQVKHIVENLYQNTVSKDLLNQCWGEATTLLDNSQLSFLFDNKRYEAAYNEVPVQFRYLHYNCHGIIDRLVVTEKCIYIVDYKTARIRGGLLPEELISSYATQMSIYQHGIGEIWPNLAIKTKVLFTYSQTFVDIEPQKLEQLLPA